MKKKSFLILGGAVALLLLIGFSLTLKAQLVVYNINTDQLNSKELLKIFGSKTESFTIPPDDSDLFDILVVGMRGIGENFGGSLTDTIILFRINKKTGQAAMISIPRDLYIKLPYDGDMKINEVYAIGIDKGGEKLALALERTILSQITGIHIDGVVRVDFTAFKKLIDEVGGVDIYLDKPFTEIAQWQGKGGFRLPAGLNHLNGDATLFFVRSRFSTSDFDRAKRQQEIILALKNKLTGLGILANPVKIYAMLDIIGSHIKTDYSFNIPQILSLANTLDYRNIKQIVLSTQNYLYQSNASNGAYILLPKAGNYSDIQYLIKNIFTLSAKKYEKPLNNYYPLQKTATPTKPLEKS